MLNIAPCQKRKLNTHRRRDKLVWKDARDLNQYRSLFVALESTLNNNHPLEIVQEISMYSSGLMIKCNDSKCDGYIHYLRSDNFNDNKVYDNPWKLFTYKCDNQKCQFETHLFDCSSCGDIIQIGIDVHIYPNHLCQLVSNCHSIYCNKMSCWQTNLIKCKCCFQEYCQKCSNNNNNNDNCSDFHCCKCLC